MRLTWLAVFIAVSAAAQNTATPEQFLKLCALCHGAEATGGDRGPSLVSNGRLRGGRSAAEIRDIILNGTPGGMPAFNLPELQLQTLTNFVRSLNATAFELKPDGDAAAGERFSETLSDTSVHIRRTS